MQNKPHIAVVFSAFMSGGAETVCLWILEALKKDYNLSLVTFTPVNWNKINALYGTNLGEDSVKTVSPVPKWLSSGVVYFFKNISQPHPWLQHLLMRYYKKHSKKFDLGISAYNEMDLQKPGIQYVHAPKYVLGRRRHERVSGYSIERMKQNLTLTCSDFVAKKYERFHGEPATVVFPPVDKEYPKVEWETKEFSFISCGRLAPEKEPHKAIELLKRVRSRGHPVKLHIVGTEVNKAYLSHLRALQKENKEWVSLHVSRPRKEFIQLLSNSRFAIHFRIEGFGITIAELMKAGCIPFVYGVGGQLEVVGKNEALIFNTEEEAFEKIISVLEDRQKQESLREYLMQQATAFETESFMNRIREHVLTFFNEPTQKVPGISKTA